MVGHPRGKLSDTLISHKVTAPRPYDPDAAGFRTKQTLFLSLIQEWKDA